MRRFCIILCLWSYCWQLSAQYPRIYVSPDDKATICAKINNEVWAAESFDKIRRSVEKLADRHTIDPEWIVSRLAMYWKDGERYTQCYLKNQNWDRGEGNAPVPTVRMPGMRTWNKYVNVPLDERIPYNETGDMWGRNRHNPTEPAVLVPYKESGHMIRGNNVEILTLAENAAFVYWITGEEKFARFAADIFNTWLVGTYYMNPILDPEKSCGSEGGWAPGGICGYYDYEQIHDDLAMHAAVVYDFMHDYLQSYIHPHLLSIGISTHEVAEVVFRRFIELGLVRGGKEGNWNVNGWNMILRPILLLDGNDNYPDGKGREYYLHYLINETTPYHAAIPDMVKNYDAVTGLWPESPGYAFSTIQMILEWAYPLQRAGIDIIAENPILQKAATAIFPWLDDASNLIVFGDSRGGSANFQTFEHLLTYYSQIEDEEGRNLAASALNKAIDLGKYSRSATSWNGLCTYESHIPIATISGGDRASYSPHHRMITMKNGNSDYKMMANIYGGKKGFHLTPNGLALQLYAYGYALVPDAAAYESYWSKDYGYHQSPLGTNTIMPGYTEGEISVNIAEPMPCDGQFYTSESLTPYLNFADVSAGEKRRVIAMVSVGENAGYYVDIFRSDLFDNDYLFHNVGHRLLLYDKKGQRLVTENIPSLQSLSNHSYRWFSDIQACANTDNFYAEWSLPQSMTARLWMTGADGRTIHTMNAPATTMNHGLTPDNCGMPPNSTPTLLVRQADNNAYTTPFMTVYEAFKNNNYIVSHISPLRIDGRGVGLSISLVDGRNDYVISAETTNTLLSVKKMFKAKAHFVHISMQDREVQSIYMAGATLLKNDDWLIESLTSLPISVAIYKDGDDYYYSSTGKVLIKHHKKRFVVEKGIHIKL